MKEKYYYGTMFVCNGIILACLTLMLETDFFMKTFFLIWAGYMFGLGLLEFMGGVK